jgi:Icc-related predicted phosphoesterase
VFYVQFVEHMQPLLVQMGHIHGDGGIEVQVRGCDWL